MKVALRLSIIGSALAFLAGCGGVARTQVKGTVEYEGKPVALGVIYINPDTTKKNDGPQGYAEIQNGTFDTSQAKGKGKGTVSGPVVVRVEAFDGKADDERPKGAMLFAYEKRVDLGKGVATLDLKIQPGDVLKQATSTETVGP